MLRAKSRFNVKRFRSLAARWREQLTYGLRGRTGRRGAGAHASIVPHDHSLSRSTALEPHGRSGAQSIALHGALRARSIARSRLLTPSLLARR